MGKLISRFFFFYTNSHFLLQQTLSTSLGGTWSAAVCWSLAMVGGGTVALCLDASEWMETFPSEALI